MKSPANDRSSIRLLAATAIVLVGLTSTAPASQAGTAVSVVHVFHHVSDGAEGKFPGPVAGLPDETLYGTTAEGGTYGAGTVFEIRRDGQLVTLHSFGGPQGSYPDPCLVVAADGAIYGTIGSTGRGAYQGVKYVFRTGINGKVSIAAKMYPPSSPADDWSALIQGTDGLVYALTNYPMTDSNEFGLTVVGSVQGKLSGDAFQLVHRRVGSSGFMNFNAISEKSELAQAAREMAAVNDEAIQSSVSRHASPQCGDTTITADHHFWSPVMNHFGTWRSVTTNLIDDYYAPVREYVGKSSANTLIDNPDYREAASAFGRFADAPHDSIWATTRVFGPNGQSVAYEIIQVSPLGKITRRIKLNELGEAFSPIGGLVSGPGGYIYGLAEVANNGTNLLYRFRSDQSAPDSSVQIIYRFTNTLWMAGPQTLWTDLAVGGDGNLYVTFPRGGKYEQGIIYRVSIAR